MAASPSQLKAAIAKIDELIAALQSGALVSSGAARPAAAAAAAPAAAKPAAAAAPAAAPAPAAPKQQQAKKEKPKKEKAAPAPAGAEWWCSHADAGAVLPARTPPTGLPRPTLPLLLFNCS